MLISDVALAFVIIDASLAAFVLAADQKPLAAVMIGLAGSAFGVLSILPVGDRIRDLALLGAALVVGAGFNFAFVLGHPTHAPFHDSALLTDAAAQGLLEGRNPYGLDYLHSAMRFFYTPDVPVNFALSHYVYPPLNILEDLPLRVLAHLGGPDLGFQVLYPIALVALAGGCYKMGEPGVRRATLTAIALNPLLIADSSIYFLNDVFFLAPSLGAVAALRARRPVLAGVLFGLALATKQQAILLAPYLLVGGWALLGRPGLMKAAIATALAAGLVVAPFLIWSPPAFITGVAGFFYGSGIDVSPIRGASLPGLLVGSGVLPNRWVAFPSAVFQLIFTAPFLGLSLMWLARRWSWPAAWTSLAILAALTFFFGRILAPNYIDLAFIFLTLGFAESLAREEGLLRAATPAFQPA